MVEGWMFIGRGVRRFSGWPVFGHIRCASRASPGDSRGAELGGGEGEGGRRRTTRRTADIEIGESSNLSGWPGFGCIRLDYLSVPNPAKIPRRWLMVDMIWRCADKVFGRFLATNALAGDAVRFLEQSALSPIQWWVCRLVSVQRRENLYFRQYR